MKNKKTEIIVLAVILVLQSLLFVYWGSQKIYLHMDEAYSLGLAGYHRVEIQDEPDFYNQWHENEYYEDYLIINQDEVGSYSQVYENQKNDVHPPLYYLFLRVAMGFSVDEFSMWPGIVLNIIFYLFITLFTYLILKRAMKHEKFGREIAAAFSLLAACTLAAFENVIYIRMYALTALIILITVYLHLRLVEDEKLSVKWLVLVGLSSLAGSLTHYYFLFYLVPLFLIYFVRFLRGKNFKSLGLYTLTMALAGGASLAIFPHSLTHMFFGYRGEGFIEKLKDKPQFIDNFIDYFWKLNDNAFNKFLLFAAILFCIIYIYKRNYCSFKPAEKDEKAEKESREVLKTLYVPTLFYFTIVSVASPWIELRYVAPVCGITFVLVLYYLVKVLREVIPARSVLIFMLAFCLIMISAPFRNDITPRMTFKENSTILDRVAEDTSVPAIYFFNSSENRFLDDILLFSRIEESYVAKDFEMTPESYKPITEGRDLSKGVYVFINAGQHNDNVLGTFCQSSGLNKVRWVQRLNACDVYYACYDENEG